MNADDAEVDISATALEPSTNKGIGTSTETTTSSDCLSVSHYYAKFNFSSFSLLQAGGGETDESGLSDIDSSHSGDVFSEGSESESDTFSNEAGERANGTRDFIREAVLRLVEIKGTVGFSISTFEDLLKWLVNLHCENNEAARCHWPSSWEDVQTLLGDIGKCVQEFQ